MTQKPDEFSYPACPARAKGRNFGQLISKCLAFALRVAASPTDHPKLHGHAQPLDRQVLKAPLMPAVPES